MHSVVVVDAGGFDSAEHAVRFAEVTSIARTFNVVADNCIINS